MINRNQAHGIVVNLGPSLAVANGVEDLITKAAYKGETGARILVGEKLTQEQAVPLAVYLQSLGFQVELFREFEKTPAHILVLWN